MRLRFATLPFLAPLVFFLGWVSAPGRGTAVEPPGAGGIFHDATAESGLDFVHRSGQDGRLLFVEMNGSGLALLDFDGDGDLDLFFPQGHRLDPEPKAAPPGKEARGRLYRNDLEAPGAMPRFVDVTETSGLDARGYGMGAAAADYDNDGDIDLYLSNFGSNQLWRNRGDGTFEDVTTRAGVDDPRWSLPAVFFDYDRDGWLDLFVANYVDYTLATHRVCSRPTGAPDYCGPLAWRGETDRLWRNRGDGTFEDVTVRAGLGRARGNALGALAADFDGDGWSDLFVANDQMVNFLWRNQGDGTFVDDALLAGVAVNGEGHPEASMGVSAGDYDADGDEDLFMTHIRGETHTLYRHEGNGFFDDVTGASGLGPPSWELTGFGTAFLDFDNDGRLDLLAVDGAVRILEALEQAGDPRPLRQVDQLFHNLGDGRFEVLGERAGAAFGRATVSRGAAVGDLDDDGDPDVVILDNDGPARLLIDTVGQDRPWLGLRLLTARRDALGAWVGVSLARREAGADTTPRWRRVRAQESFASSRDPRLLFGFGDLAEKTAGGTVEGATVEGATVEGATVEVHWPDGRGERFWVEGLGRYHTLRQGEGENLAAPADQKEGGQ